MIDIYSRAVLTIIAIALVALVAQNFNREATAQLGSTCQKMFPCYVEIIDRGAGVSVYVKNEPLWTTNEAPQTMRRR